MSTNYEKRPIKVIKNGEGKATQGWSNIINLLKTQSGSTKKQVIVIDCYPGVDINEIEKAIAALNPTLLINSDNFAWQPKQMEDYLTETLTEDRVFGFMTDKNLSDFFVKEKIESAREEIDNVDSGIVCVYGTGAALVTEGDILIHATISRWELQLRYRSGQANWRCNNTDAPILSKYKWGFFAQWRWADKHKTPLYERLDYVLSMNNRNSPAMVTGDGFRDGLRQLAREPFRTVPYFDEGVWGGQWMKKVCGLDPSVEKYAWAFDGVPEENSILLSYGGVEVELPAIDLVLYQPLPLLGKRVYSQYGAEFPMRFDFLDTMGGGKLSLQVHPLTAYIKAHFGMKYTQDESYYILDAKPGACAYLGIKEGIDPAEMEKDLRAAQTGEITFDADKFVNCYPIKKHDHILIPAGTVHCSCEDTMVLEISATPYIFTFKLWDWGQVGLDGRPRPIHLEHGLANIQWDRNTTWINENCIGQEEVLEKSAHLQIDKTGLHPFEPIETLRYTLENGAPVKIEANDSVRMLNLVEGSAIRVSDKNNSFEPMTIHYAETFILPASVEDCIITPCYPEETCKVVLAYIRE